MSKINILDESVFNKISAGEVVEKPASVVKELLDNSIDAGATKIQVSIEDGGISNITISDNGCGIDEDDFDKVFLAHATSKIKTSDDLATIGTLGFRGEALASIASVSKVILTSKTATNEFACTCQVQGGKQSETTYVGSQDGTTISVSDLFFNVPARAKFLRKPKSEANEITNLIERYILCNPTISFTYSIDQKVIYQSTGTNLFDAIYVVYGKQAIEGITKVDYYNKNSDIKIDGYIGLPTFSKPNRTYQTLSINGRYILSPLVSTCISNAYEHFLMKGQFPFYVLNLTIPFEKIDVNVHPNKMEVRFGNSNEIYGNVFNAISSTLFNCEKITSVNQQVTNYNEVSDGVSFVAEQSKDNDLSQSAKTVEIHINDIQKQKTEDLKYKDFMSFIKKPDNKYDTLHDNSETIYSKIAQMEVETQYSNQTTLSENFNKSKTEDFFETSDVKFVGEIFATYLIIEKQQKVYIIDEHAGHERLLFERLVREVDSKSVVKQSLLVPFQLKVNRQEFEFLDENLDKLQKIGFEIEEFGELSFMVSAVPSLLSEINLTEFFNNILSDLTVLKNYKQSDLIIDKLMQHSCKCAVRSGKILSAGEVNSLISQMKNEKIQLQCPHGRPIVVELLKSDVEKWFKRIV